MNEIEKNSNEISLSGGHGKLTNFTLLSSKQMFHLTFPFFLKFFIFYLLVFRFGSLLTSVLSASKRRLLSFTDLEDDKNVDFQFFFLPNC